jgi:hypothetical protein
LLLIALGWQPIAGTASVEHAVIYANQAGTHTQNDHVPGFGCVNRDPTSPNVWVYSRQSC